MNRSLLCLPLSLRSILLFLFFASTWMAKGLTRVYFVSCAFFRIVSISLTIQNSVALKKRTNRSFALSYSPAMRLPGHRREISFQMQGNLYTVLGRVCLRGLNKSHQWSFLAVGEKGGGMKRDEMKRGWDIREGLARLLASLLKSVKSIESEGETRPRPERLHSRKVISRHDPSTIFRLSK